jgi:hypothetical protein
MGAYCMSMNIANDGVNGVIKTGYLALFQPMCLMGLDYFCFRQVIITDARAAVERARC